MDEAPISHHEFPILGKAYFLGGRASTSVKRALGDAGVEPEVIQRISVACYEAEMNVVLHARSGYVQVDVYPTRVEVRIVDQGPGIENIQLAMTPGWSSAGEEARSLGFGAGMGLPNIKAQVDDFAIQSAKGRGVTLTLTFLRGGNPDD
jgi:anti-sigma regulatory factor (Ser/Thr protein kinase)